MEVLVVSPKDKRIPYIQESFLEPLESEMGSFTDPTVIYTITVASLEVGDAHCTCPDYQKRGGENNPEHRCKHIRNLLNKLEMVTKFINRVVFVMSKTKKEPTMANVIDTCSTLYWLIGKQHQNVKHFIQENRTWVVKNIHLALNS